MISVLHVEEGTCQSLLEQCRQEFRDKFSKVDSSALSLDSSWFLCQWERYSENESTLELPEQTTSYNILKQRKSLILKIPVVSQNRHVPVREAGYAHLFPTLHSVTSLWKL